MVRKRQSTARQLATSRIQAQAVGNWWTSLHSADLHETHRASLRLARRLTRGVRHFSAMNRTVQLAKAQGLERQLLREEQFDPFVDGAGGGQRFVS